MRRRDSLDLALVLAASLAIRLWGFRWGLPGPAGEMTPITRAWQFWNWGGHGGPSFNPHDFGWPSLVFYLAFLQQALCYAWGRVSGSFAGTADFRVLYHLDPSPIILVGRAFSSAADLGSIALTWYLARSLFGRVPAIAAAAVVALDLQHVAWSQNTGPEVWVCLFVLAATVSLRRIASGAGAREYALFGLWTGLGIAAKYTPAILLAALPFAQRAGRTHRPSSRPLRPLLLALGAAAAAFVIASPYVLLDAGESLFYIVSQTHRLAAAPHFGQETLGPGWLFYLRHSLTPSIGPVWLLAGILGMVVMLRGFRREEGCLFIFPALYFLLFGAGASKYDHYMLPVTPFLAMAGAGLLWRFFARPWPALPAAVAAIGLLFPAVGVARRHAVLSRPDTRAQARDWIEKNIPAGSLILAEFGGPDLLTQDRLQSLGTDPETRDIAPRLLPALQRRPAYAVYTLPLYTQEPEESAPFYHLALYRGFQYCVLSSEVSGRYRARGGHFGTQINFYRRVASFGHGLENFKPGPDPGPTIEIYSLAGAIEASAASDGGSADAAARDAWQEVRRYASLRAERAGDFGVRLGRACDTHGDLTDAIVAWGMAAEFTPNDVALRVALGEALGRTGRDDLARREFERALSLDPNEVGALTNLGGLELRAGRLDQARRLLERALAIQPDYADAHANLGWVLWVEGRDAAGARREFESALRLAPAHPGAERLRMTIDQLARHGFDRRAPSP